MNVIRGIAAITVAAWAFACNAQQTGMTVTHASGGSIQTQLSPNIIVNKGSSLTREWLAIQDSSMPVSLVETPGVKTVYQSGRVSGDYKYIANYSVKPKEALSAIEVRFLVFDLWGNHTRTLVATEIRDMEPGDTFTFDGTWNIYSENETAAHFASLAYIAKARTKSGRVIEVNRASILAEARKLSKKLTDEDLEPKKEKK